MKKLICIKRLIEIDIHQSKCLECCKKGLSGFIDKEMCQDFNLSYKEESDDRSNF
jgi:hypothetical protein